MSGPDIWGDKLTIHRIVPRREVDAMVSQQQVIDLVFRSCLLLDEEKFDDYIGLFASDCNYRITTYSPDLRKEQTWLDLNHSELQSLLKNLEYHVRLPGRLMRHPGGPFIGSRVGMSEVFVSTSILVIHTDLEGNSSIFAAGKYQDLLAETSEGLRFQEREVRLDTRQFGPGSHVPL